MHYIHLQENCHEVAVSGNQVMLMIFHQSVWSINQKLHIANPLITVQCKTFPNSYRVCSHQQLKDTSVCSELAYTLQYSEEVKTLHPNKDVPDVDWGRSLAFGVLSPMGQCILQPHACL